MELQSRQESRPRPNGRDSSSGGVNVIAEMDGTPEDALLSAPLRALRQLVREDLRGVIREELQKGRLFDTEDNENDNQSLASEASASPLWGDVDEKLFGPGFDRGDAAERPTPTSPQMGMPAPSSPTTGPPAPSSPSGGQVGDMPTREASAMSVESQAERRRSSGSRRSNGSQHGTPRMRPPRISNSTKDIMRDTESVQPMHLLGEERVSTRSKLALCNARVAAGRLGRWADGWDWFMHEVKEPKREGRLAQIVDGKGFEYLFAFVILVNAVFMAFAMNHQAANPRSAETPFIRNVDLVFLGLYILELVLKFIVHREYFFFGDVGWKVLDFALVVYGIIDAILEEVIGSGQGSNTWMRSLRLFKTAKVLRMLRVIKVLKELNLLMACILGSLRALMWSLLLMAVILYMFSLVFVQQATVYLAKDLELQNPETSAGLEDKFGSVQSSILTLFQSVFDGDDWAQFHHLMSEAGIVGDVMFILFVGFANIALLNILTGIFVENALKLAQPSFFEKATEHHKDLVEQATVLRDLCKEWDENQNGLLSFTEFCDLVQNPKVRKYLDYLGLEVPSLEMFFSLLADESQQVNINTFVDACMRLRGDAKSIDMKQLLLELKVARALKRDVKTIKHYLTQGQYVVDSGAAAAEEEEQQQQSKEAKAVMSHSASRSKTLDI